MDVTRYFLAESSMVSLLAESSNCGMKTLLSESLIRPPVCSLGDYWLVDYFGGLIIGDFSILSIEGSLRRGSTSGLF